MTRLIRKYRLFKGPFMIASLSGLTAIFLSFIWVLAEVLTELGICDVVFETHILLLVGFPICFGGVIYSMRRYLKNGYVRQEIFSEAVFKNIDTKTNFNKLNTLKDCIRKEIR